MFYLKFLILSVSPQIVQSSKPRGVISKHDQTYLPSGKMIVLGPLVSLIIEQQTPFITSSSYVS